MAGLIDLKKLQSIIQRTPEEKNLPKHLILNLFPLNSQEENKKEEFNKLLDIFFEMMDLQKEKNIPIMTISLGGKEDIDENVLFEKTKLILKKANEYRMKVSVFGRWYDLRGQLVEELKRLNSETDGFDNFFLNICINYDPKQEIADASRVIIRKILMEKLDIDSITPEIIKENIYSSFFVPPDIVIEPSRRFSGTFLWDSKNSKIYQLNKKVLDINKADVI
ncbi:MAG: undecaprenyl diphosphate synthase family protein, partial [Nanoarchaeota archaeon]